MRHVYLQLIAHSFREELEAFLGHHCTQVSPDSLSEPGSAMIRVIATPNQKVSCPITIRVHQRRSIAG